MRRLFVIIGLVMFLFLPVVVQADEIDIIGIERYEGMSIEAGTDKNSIKFTEGLTLLNNTGGLIEEKLLVDTLLLDTTQVGTYPVVYYVLFKDGSNNIRYNVKTINVNVVDSKKPVLSGVKVIFVPIGTSSINYLQGVTATDNDQSSSLDIKVFNSSVDLNTLGTYDIVYYVMDKSGNYTSIKTKVVVEPVMSNDTVAPTIENLKESYSFGLNQASRSFLSGVSATDNVDGDITSNIQVDESKIDYTQLGDYVVYFIVSDARGNITIVPRPVTIVNDTIRPELFNVNKNITVKTSYDLLEGVQAFDDICGDISHLVTYEIIDTNFDINVLGSYQVLYKITDLNGNNNQKIGIVNVVDNVKPVIKAPDYIDIKVNTSFNLLERIKVTDNYDTSVDVQITGQLDLSKPGSYFISVTATDASNNTAIKQFFVNVYDVKQNEIQNNPIVIGSAVGIVVSGIVTLIGVRTSRSRKSSYKNKKKIKNNNKKEF